MSHKELKDYTFSELVDLFAGQALSELLVKGGAGLRTELHQAMQTAIRWSQEDKKKQTGKTKQTG